MDQAYKEKSHQTVTIYQNLSVHQEVRQNVENTDNQHWFLLDKIVTKTPLSTHLDFIQWKFTLCF